MTALREGPELYAEAILEACFENRQFDPQCEVGRAPYLLALADRANLTKHLLSELLIRIPTTEDRRDRNQMVDLLVLYAGRGEEEAWNLLITIAADGDENAQDELATLNERGLIWVSENVLPSLPPQDRWRISMWLPDEEADDCTPTQTALRSLYQTFDRQRKSQVSAPESTPSPAEFLSRLSHEPPSWQASAAFAKQASESELAKAAEHFLQTKNDSALRSLSRVFRQRPYPLHLDTLLPHIDDEDRGDYVRTILGRIDDPQLREFGLTQLQRDPLPSGSLEILRKSAQADDLSSIREALDRFTSDDLYEQHQIVLDLVSLLFSHPHPEWQPLAEWLYENSPCSFCRESGVRWIGEHGSIPETIRQERRYDAEPDIRSLIAKGSGE